MTKTKTKEVMRIGGIAAPCGNGTHIMLPRTWVGRRVFACLKEEWDGLRKDK